MFGTSAPVAGAKASISVVGGVTAGPNDYPWAAYIVFHNTTACEGTLIAPQWVLTAAHCVLVSAQLGGTSPTWPPSLVQITLGHAHLTHTSADAQITPSQVLVDPLYTDTTGLNDLALLELPTPATEQPVHIVAPSEARLWTPGVAAGTVVGWGATIENGAAVNDLMAATMPILSDSACQATVSGYDPTMMLCAGLLGVGGRDACQGDSGGGLLVPNGPGLWRVAGTVSFGVGCARPYDPGVYMRLAAPALYNWIFATATGLEYPVASFTVTPSKPVAGQRLTLRSTSTDTAGLALPTATWDLGNGRFGDASGSQVTTTLPVAGTLTLRLAVVDTRGIVDEAAQTISVAPAPAPAPKRKAKTRCTIRRRRIHGRVRKVRVCTRASARAHHGRARR